MSAPVPDWLALSLAQARKSLDACEAAMREERWADALVELMPAEWAVDALRDKMPRPDPPVIVAGAPTDFG